MVRRQLTDWSPGERAVIEEGRRPDLSIPGGMVKARGGVVLSCRTSSGGLHRGRSPRLVFLSVKLSIISYKKYKKLSLD